METLGDAETLRLLEALEFGQPDAEAEHELTVAVFVKPPAFQEILDKKKGLIVANRGVGKTAIVEYLEEAGETLMESTKIAACHVNRELMLDPNAVKHFGEEGSRGAFRAAWLSLLTKMTVTTLVTKGILRRRSSVARVVDDSESLLQRLIKASPTISIWISPDGEFKTGADFSMSPVSEDERKLKFREILKTCDEHLANKGYNLWLLIDDLDDLFFPELQRRNTAIAALLELWDACRNTYRNIFLKIFTRSDVLQSLQYIGKPKLFGKFVSLGWDRRSLLHWAARRILIAPEIRSYCEKAVNCDLSRIGPRPSLSERDLERVFYSVFQKRSASSGSDLNYLISERSVREARLVLHRYRVETHLGEFAEYDDDLYPTMMRIISSGKTTFGRREIEELGHGNNSREHKRLISLLYHIGFLEPVGDTRNVDYAEEFLLPYIYWNHEDRESREETFDWICRAARDSQGELPREMIVAFRTARKTEIARRKQ